MKTVLITGASSGIGKALSYKFAAEGFNLIIVARRIEALEQIKQDIESKYPAIKVYVETADLSKDGSAKQFYEKLNSFQIDVLINNAGFGDYGFPWDVNLEKANDMINLNIKALTDLSLLYVKDYADKDSTLINTASIGGYAQFDIAVIYCATKFYVASFTEGLALAMQTQGKKMRVKVLAPAATSTEFVGQASVNGGIDGDHLFSPEAFISAEQLADYAYQLYQSDKVVGIVNERWSHMFEQLKAYL
ncbi:SDR family NAD(P)-dependent oxidoreductase [Acinetobacter nosocomialis]|uniref:SDR family NAD(P)-dependent oxidoreductase n=1 Tax=Acinetobacter nosocomialis TaxID=106654 RepID=UPI000DE6AAA9|nr:SDR family NAD(P)-dependent oxidoreductase [Acinetobacter nosocomialis]RSN80293.1 SDR family NAD(P)-dependent oxidoreductase [Acinetobacter nosocomialis]SSO23950.1 short-chain dehydrogenase/reductase SDR [Acinetobacter nosocomialis]SSQ88210.1 short-chain dehydrogenase/reductase SDR [Acinetobacter nosocomialis]